MLEQRLRQKLLQKLSPQQIQLMKLLQVPTASLEQRIKEELEANPALEEGEEDEFPEIKDSQDSADEEENKNEEADEPTAEEEIDWDEYFDDDEIPDYKTKSYNYPDPDEEKTIPHAVVDSFQEFLVSQLGMLGLTGDNEVIARQLVGNIDEDGYIRRELVNILDDLAFTQNVMTDEASLKKNPGTGTDF